MFLVQDGGVLVEMRQNAYDSEALLQDLLEKYPSMIAGDQINPTAPRRWLLVFREIGVPDVQDGSSRWSLDHLFLDQDAVPTLVEVKRSTDTRIRREVVGQMLDYAANALAYWPVETIRAQFEARCEGAGINPAEELLTFLAAEADPERFWQDVKTNLQAGRVRLVFVADEIPRELQRIIEYLNGQMSNTEVLGVAIQQFGGEGQRVYVPRVIGQTAAAQQTKSAGSAAARQWDEVTFFAELESRRGPREVAIARRVFDWAKVRGLRIWWGRGQRSGSMFPMLDKGSETYWTVSLWTYGSIEIQFAMLRKLHPFDKDSARRELQAKLNKLPGVSISDASLTQRPPIRMSALVEDKAASEFISILDWMVEQFDSARDEAIPSRTDSITENA